MQKKSVMIR